MQKVNYEVKGTIQTVPVQASHTIYTKHGTFTGPISWYPIMLK